MTERSLSTANHCRSSRQGARGRGSSYPEARARILALGLTCLGGLGLAACSGSKGTGQGPTVSVQIALARKMPIEHKVTCEAILYALKQAAITPKISAPVQKYYVERGSHVRAGELLAELENRDLKGAATEAKGAYEQAQATFETTTKGSLPEEIQKAQLDLKAARETLDAAEKVYAARQTLFQQGAIAHKDLDDALVSLTQARNAFELAQKHLQALQAFGKQQELKAAAGQLASAQGRYASAQAQLGYAQILSPINGVVTDRPVYPGEMVPSGSPLITVMDLSRVVARAHISQQLAQLLKVGNAATISETGANDALPGKVTLVSPALDPNSTTVEVWVEASNPGERLRPGSSVRLSIVAEKVPNAIVVPAAAVLTGSDGSTSVMVVDSGDKPHSRDVKVGIRDSENVQIVEGLKAGERVVTVGAFELASEDPNVLAKTQVAIQAPPGPPASEASGGKGDNPN